MREGKEKRHTLDAFPSGELVCFVVVVRGAKRECLLFQVIEVVREVADGRGM